MIRCKRPDGGDGGLLNMLFQDRVSELHGGVVPSSGVDHHRGVAAVQEIECLGAQGMLG